MAATSSGAASGGACLYAVGGDAGASPSEHVHISLVEDTGSGPQLSSWNLQGTLTEGRLFPGACAARGFIFVAGGEGRNELDAPVILNSIEKVLQ